MYKIKMMENWATDDYSWNSEGYAIAKTWERVSDIIDSVLDAYDDLEVLDGWHVDDVNIATFVLENYKGNARLKIEFFVYPIN